MAAWMISRGYTLVGQRAGEVAFIGHSAVLAVEVQRGESLALVCSNMKSQVGPGGIGTNEYLTRFTQSTAQNCKGALYGG